MITKTVTRYTSQYKASKLERLPVARVVTDYTCTKIHFNCDVKFQRTLNFLNKKTFCYSHHPIRPKYGNLGGFGKIQVDKRNRKIYLGKQTYKKRHDIVVLTGEDYDSL